MDKKEIVTKMCGEIADAAAKGNTKRLEYVSSLLTAFNRGNPTPKQMAAIERVCNGTPDTAFSPAAFLAAFKDATRLTSRPKVIVEVSGTV